MHFTSSVNTAGNYPLALVLRCQSQVCTDSYLATYDYIPSNNTLMCIVPLPGQLHHFGIAGLYRAPLSFDSHFNERSCHHLPGSLEVTRSDWLHRPVSQAHLQTLPGYAFASGHAGVGPAVRLC